MARTLSQKHFVSWPKVADESGKACAVKKPSQKALKSNDQLLHPWLGRSVLHKKLGHKDFILNCLVVVSEYWSVPCRIFGYITWILCCVNMNSE